MPLRIPRPADLATLVGTELSPSDEFALNQADVDRFVEISGDRQWIHSDTERARAELPEGRTIVPGNLLLAQIPRLLQQVYVVERFAKCLVAGYSQVRFRQIVGTGTPLALRVKLVSVTPTRSFVRVETECTIMIADDRKPALTVQVTDLYYE
ncbi:MaoC/PaaZ C-terminal domain-containing protein [Bradyrhizobium prioriisuperbiae]|uniref:MaoC/PaaZ C-terminal domain-containing protein n=1 Tax=Bradyrhizobium prioriisuperbiae TaxID=2854389 RepID=UPI0028EC8281|nr:MaoC/PaaZ C-terminal domain-containing protein [Bradyrhizobium prioritasuperba]